MFGILLRFFSELNLSLASDSRPHDVSPMVKEEAKPVKKSKKKKTPGQTANSGKQPKRTSMDNVEAEFFRSNRGRALLRDPTDRHTYYKNVAIGTKVYWRCRWSKQLKCRANAVSEGFYLVSKAGTHNHDCNADPRVKIGRSE